MSKEYRKILSDIKSTISKFLKEGIIVNPTFSEKNYDESQINSSREETGIVKSLNYIDVYRKHVDERNYGFQLFDGSLIQFSYTFIGGTKQKKVSALSLSYYPNPDPSLSDELEIDKGWYVDYKEKIESLSNNLEEYIDLDSYIFGITSNYSSRYIRLEYSKNDSEYTEVFHPKCHLHMSLNNNFRLGVNKLPMLSEFLDFIFYLHYEEVWKYLHEISGHDLESYIDKTKNELHLAYDTELLSTLDKKSYFLNII